MSTAEDISAIFGDDGQVFQAPFGEGMHRTLDSVSNDHKASVEWRDGMGTGTYRYTYPDGSVITVAGDGWDFGYPCCYCWQGAGHTQECIDEREAKRKHWQAISDDWTENREEILAKRFTTVWPDNA